MIVGESKTPEMDCIFASLVPGFPTPPPPANASELNSSKVTSVEASPIIPCSNAEKNPDDISEHLLRLLLEYMVSQVCFIIIFFIYET